MYYCDDDVILQGQIKYSIVLSDLIALADCKANRYTRININEYFLFSANY